MFAARNQLLTASSGFSLSFNARTYEENVTSFNSSTLTTSLSAGSVGDLAILWERRIRGEVAFPPSSNLNSGWTLIGTSGATRSGYSGYRHDFSFKIMTSSDISSGTVTSGNAEVIEHTILFFTPSSPINYVGTYDYTFGSSDLGQVSNQVQNVTTLGAVSPALVVGVKTTCTNTSVSTSNATFNTPTFDSTFSELVGEALNTFIGKESSIIGFSTQDNALSDVTASFTDEGNAQQAATFHMTFSDEATRNVSGVSATGNIGTVTAGTVADPGQTAYTSVGTYTFVVPSGITSISAVVVGGGGGAAGTGSNRGGAGGGGGGLAYGTFDVTSGESLTVQVGAGGSGGANYSTDGSDGQASFIKRGSTVLLRGRKGTGGTKAQAYGTTFQSNTHGVGGISEGTERDGGGTGGKGGLASWNYAGGAGGGAAGYSGNGGHGHMGNNNSYVTADGLSASSGSGGGGSGGTCTFNNCGGGGGVGILGEGSSGSLPSAGQGGNGGSGGANGTVGNSSSNGGAYGGGGGADDDDYTGAGGSGAQGAVRIIWGPGRSYPSTNTGDV